MIVSPRQCALVLILFFLFSAGMVPVVQIVLDARRVSSQPGNQMAHCPELTALSDPIYDSPVRSDPGLFRQIGNWSERILQQIHHIEHNLEKTSFLRPIMLKLLPLVHRLGLGGENVLIGRNGWLYYRPDVAYLTDRSAKLADSIETIVDFHHQLAARGISLVVAPTPVKPSIEPGFLWNRYASRKEPLLPPAYAAWLQALRDRDIRVFDAHRVLMQLKNRTHESGYLQTDTHWTPRAMESVASALADEIRPDAGPGALGFDRQEHTISARGDIAVMLNSGVASTDYPPETVSVNAVTLPGHGPWRESLSAGILLMGDSFSNIYSLESMGWGGSAGFAEQLSYYLKQPLDRIVQNDAGAIAGRRILSQSLARGKDRLAEKKMVIWQFAIRELAFGDWQPIELKLDESGADRSFIVPKPGEVWTVSGIVESVSSIPLPGSVPYSDHIASVHLADIRSGNPSLNYGQALVYIHSMKNNQWTSAARLRTGDRVCMKLRSWSDVADQLGGINRSEPDGDDLLLAEPCWGELIF